MFIKRKTFTGNLLIVALSHVCIHPTVKGVPPGNRGMFIGSGRNWPGRLLRVCVSIDIYSVCECVGGLAYVHIHVCLPLP